MPELGPYGSVRGARGNSRPYRESRRGPARWLIERNRTEIERHGEVCATVAQTLSGGPNCQKLRFALIAGIRRLVVVALKTKSLARNHKTGCIWSGSASAPPSNCTRGQIHVI